MFTITTQSGETTNVFDLKGARVAITLKNGSRVAGKVTRVATNRSAGTELSIRPMTEKGVRPVDSADIASVLVLDF